MRKLHVRERGQRKKGFTGHVVFLAPVIVFFLSLPVWGNESYSIEAVQFLPPSYRVGEPVELRITLRVSGDIPLETPEEMPEPGWIDFHGVEIVRKGDITDVRILFVSFQPGLRTISALDLGGIVLEPIKIHTASVLDVDPPPFSDPAGQMLLPGTPFLLLLSLAVVLAVPVLGLSLFPRMKRRILDVLARRRRKKPLERLKRVLAQLGQPDGTAEGDSFYSTLIPEFRLYLADRAGNDFLSTTTGEFERNFRRIVRDESLAGELAGFFDRGDRVRFGGCRADQEECAGALTLVENAARRIEETLEASPGPAGRD